jgi:peptidoglycan/LPS O-acetylase OafA/YrhL
MLRSSERIHGLDGLRAIAALSVVIFHFTIGYQDWVGRHATPVLFRFPFGHFGVELFFIISGFVILWTLNRSKDLRSFAIERVARLYPAYIVCACLTAFFLFALNFNVIHVWYKYAFLNAVIGLPYLLRVHMIDPSYWTLTYEVIFYAFAGVMFFLFRRIRVEYWCLGWLAIAVASRLLIHPDWARIAVNVYYANFFVAGMMIFSLTRGGGGRLAWIALTISAALTLLPQEKQDHTLSPLWYALMSFTFMAAVWGVSRNKLHFLSWRPVALVGEASYSVYLLHQVVGYWIIFQLEQAGLSANLSIVAAIGAIIPASIAIRYWIEIPGQRAIRRMAGLRRPVLGTEEAPATARALLLIRDPDLSQGRLIARQRRGAGGELVEGQDIGQDLGDLGVVQASRIVLRHGGMDARE